MKRPDVAAKNRIRGSSSKAARGARRKQEKVFAEAADRRARRVSAGASLTDFGDPEKRAVELLAAHRLKRTPATMSIAKLHFQMQDEVDHGLEERKASRDTEARGRASIVAAGKLKLACLAQLGLPGDVEEEDLPARPAQKPEAKPKLSPAAPVAADDLEKWE